MTGFPRRTSELERLLDQFPWDSGAMDLSEFDGFVAGLLVCPDLIPPSVWLPRVLGEENGGLPAFDGVAQGRKLLDLLMQHYNAVATDLLGGNYGPIFYVDQRNDDTLWEVWFEGFEAAVVLSPESWKLFAGADEPTQIAFAGIMSLFAVAHLEDDLDTEIDESLALAEEEIDRLVEVAPDLIVRCVLALNSWRQARDAAGIENLDFEKFRAAKVGRNEPCPCGSGKKYKKCCAIKEAEALAKFRRPGAAA